MELTKEEYSKLMKRLDDLDLETRRAKAVNECSNLACRYFWYHATFRDDLIISENMWAKKSPDIHAEYGYSGVYEGYDHVIQFNQGRPTPPGKMLFHALDTSVIEVAEDCQTAKGVWLLHGAEGGSVPEGTLPEAALTKEPGLNGTRTWAHWTWAKLAIDFIVEDGEWKIWHFHLYDYCRCPFDSDPINFMMREADNSTQADKDGHPVKYYDEKGNVVYMEKADAPSTYTWHFDGLTSRSELVPRPPLKYRTFKETTSF